MQTRESLLVEFNDLTNGKFKDNNQKEIAAVTMRDFVSRIAASSVFKLNDTLAHTFIDVPSAVAVADTVKPGDVVVINNTRGNIDNSGDPVVSGWIEDLSGGSFTANVSFESGNGMLITNLSDSSKFVVGNEYIYLTTRFRVDLIGSLGGAEYGVFYTLISGPDLPDNEGVYADRSFSNASFQDKRWKRAIVGTLAPVPDTASLYVVADAYDLDNGQQFSIGKGVRRFYYDSNDITSGDNGESILVTPLSKRIKATPYSQLFENAVDMKEAEDDIYDIDPLFIKGSSGGVFYYDPSDTTTVEDGVSVFVTSSGKRLKKLTGGNSIGGPIVGGTADRVLYIDGSGNLSDSPNLTFSSNQLGLADGTAANPSLKIGEAESGFFRSTGTNIERLGLAVDGNEILTAYRNTNTSENRIGVNNNEPESVLDVHGEGVLQKWNDVGEIDDTGTLSVSSKYKVNDGEPATQGVSGATFFESVNGIARFWNDNNRNIRLQEQAPIEDLTLSGDPVLDLVIAHVNTITQYARNNGFIIPSAPELNFFQNTSDGVDNARPTAVWGNVYGAQTVEVWRSTTDDISTATLHATVTDLSTDWVDSDFLTDTTYYYFFRGILNENPSPFSESFPMLILSAPTFLTVNVVGSDNELNWEDQSAIDTRIWIERALGPTGFSALDDIASGVTTYTDTGVSTEVYFYRIRVSVVLGGTTFYSAYSNRAVNVKTFSIKLRTVQVGSEWKVSPSSGTIYFKVAQAQNVTIRWGDGNENTYAIPANGSTTQINQYDYGSEQDVTLEIEFEKPEYVVNYSMRRVHVNPAGAEDVDQNILSFLRLQTFSVTLLLGNRYNALPETFFDLPSLTSFLARNAFDPVYESTFPDAIFNKPLEKLDFGGGNVGDNVAANGFEAANVHRIGPELGDTLDTLHNILEMPDFPENFNLLVNLRDIITGMRGAGNTMPSVLREMTSLRDRLSIRNYENNIDLSTLTQLRRFEIVDSIDARPLSMPPGWWDWDYSTSGFLLSLQNSYDDLAEADTMIDSVYNDVQSHGQIASGNGTFRNINFDFSRNATPSGTYQQPSGFMLGVSNGTPASPQEKLWVLANQYNWTITI